MNVRILLVITMLFSGLKLGGAESPVITDFSKVDLRMKEALEPLSRLLEEDPTGRSAQVYLTRQQLVINVIQPYLYSGGNGDLSRRSEVRDARVKEIETILASHEGVLVDVLKRSASQSAVPNATTDLLMFAPATQSLKSALSEVVNSSDMRIDQVSDAINALIMLQLDDATIIVKILGIIVSRGERSTRAQLGDQLLQRAAGSWGIEELEPLYREFLGISFKPENYPEVGGRGALLAQYGAALRGLSFYGADNSGLSELILARIAEMDATDGDQANFIRKANETLEILKGVRAPRLAVNWKGQLLGVSKRSKAVP